MMTVPILPALTWVNRIPILLMRLSVGQIIFWCIIRTLITYPTFPISRQ